MTVHSRTRFGVLLFAIISLSCSIAFGQAHSINTGKNTEFCTGNNYSGDGRVNFKELRETPLAASGRISVDGGRNGGIVVKGSSRSDVLVRACVETWGSTDADARAVAGSIRVSTGSTIKAEGSDHSNWAVSYEILVPRNTDLNLRAVNGGIAIASVEGRIEFETTNGAVKLSDLSGEVRGNTTNGGVKVELSGSSWKGGGLDVTTTNGGVALTVPEGYSANFEMGTSNGGFKSDISALNVTQEDYKGHEYGRSRNTRLNTVLNGGGPAIRIMTTNGGVKINSAKN